MTERLKLAEGWSSFFLLWVMLLCVTTAISAARWTAGLGNLATAATLSLMVGLLLAKSRFPAMIAHLFSLVYGIFAVGFLIGRMVELPTWQDRLEDLSERAATWLTKATSGGTSRDSLMFVLLLAGLFWLLGYIAAWYTFRRPRLWRVLLPLGLTMLVNYYVYTDPRISTRSNSSLAPFLAVFVLAALVYAVRTNVYLRELEWQGLRVNYSTELRFDFVRSGGILAVIALLAMAVAPGAAASPQLGDLWEGINEMRDDVRTTVSRLFASLDARGRGLGNPFGSRAVLGGPRDLGNEVLFDVRASGGRYWRAMVYDRYTGSDWINTDDHKMLLKPGERTNSEIGLLRSEMTQTIAIYLASNSQLFAAPEPARVPALSTRVNVTFDQGRIASASAVYSQRTLKAGNVYQIVSNVSRADPDSLRSAGSAYSDEIARRYLQLPDTVTDRTRALAEEITGGHESVFDKAQAIEQYLRENLRYDLGIAAPPEGQDFVDYVLFDVQAGYCDYYATSFVVLARAVGIPARIGMGYAQGDYDDEAKAYRVRASNGHSWPEVYFPRYGWIQFEPTVIIAPISWPAAPSSGNTAASSANSERDLSDRPSRFDDLIDDETLFESGPGSFAPDLESGGVPPTLIALVGLLIVAGLGVAVTFWVTEQRDTKGLSLVERAYTRMWRFAAWLGVPNPPDQTPYERSDVLKQRVPEGNPTISRITDMYVAERFGRGNGNGDSSDADEQWKLLRPMLWKGWLQKRLGRFEQKGRSRWQGPQVPPGARNR